jgi:hypothetical protein
MSALLKLRKKDQGAEVALGKGTVLNRKDLKHIRNLCSSRCLQEMKVIKGGKVQRSTEEDKVQMSMRRDKDQVHMLIMATWLH